MDMRTFSLPKHVRTLRRKKFYTFLFLVCGLFLIFVCFISCQSRLLANNILDFSEQTQSFDLRLTDTGHHNRNLQNILPYDKSQFHLKRNKNNLSRESGLGPGINDWDENESMEDIGLTSDKGQSKVLRGKSDINRYELTDYREEFKRRFPQAIIIGVKKGGTRALLEFLRVHPDVRATGPEPHFFDKQYDKGLEWYRQMMPASSSHQITIEKTPSYFITKEVPKRVFDMSNSTKLVVVVRDPVTRAISDYAQIQSKPGPKKMKPFRELAFVHNDTRHIDINWMVIKIGIYVKHLENWLKYFPLDQFHFVNGENLVKNPGDEMIKVQKFLGLRTYITHRNFSMNNSRGFPCIKKKVRNKRGHCLDRSKGRKHPYMPDDVISSLRDFYRPYNAQFYQMTGTDFRWS